MTAVVRHKKQKSLQIWLHKMEHIVKKLQNYEWKRYLHKNKQNVETKTRNW